MGLPPSGEQFELQRDAQHATVVEVGGGLREYTVGGQPVLDGYPVDQMADGGRGQPLLPWPNRLADGAYEFDGRRLQLPVDDVVRHNANHGLTRWRSWTVAERSEARVKLRLPLYPLPGYPFLLELSLDYALEPDGLVVRTTATNRGERPLPFGAGFHPYFTVGTPTIDAAELHVPARQLLELDPTRKLPTGARLPVQGSELDFSRPRRIGSTVLDVCFTDLQREPDGCTRLSLREPDAGRELRVWMDASFGYVQVFSGESLAPERQRRGLAIEPMTCPPNALRSGADLIVLEPGASRSLAWGVQPGVLTSP
jgi:aldose 1-epimerase